MDEINIRIGIVADKKFSLDLFLKNYPFAAYDIKFSSGKEKDHYKINLFDGDLCELDKSLGSICELFERPFIKENYEFMLESYLVIAVFFETPYCSVLLNNELVKKLLIKFPDSPIEIVCYPCDEDD